MIMSRLALATTLALLACTDHASAQEWKRWIEDLGDPKRGEAAENALVDLGAEAVAGLQELVEQWDVSTTRDTDRLLAALAVADMLGEQAQELRAPLSALVISSSGKIPRGPKNREMLALVMETIGSLAPYGEGTKFHKLFHNSVVGATPEEKPTVFRAVYRYNVRSNNAVSGIEDARAKIAADKIFVRETAAEVMLRIGEMQDAVLLRDRLLDRDRRPEGWDAIKHNGFVVPSEDEFALRAARAIVRIAPDDAVSAIGFAIIANADPHRSRRLEAIRALARFGPDIEAAIPELIEIASGTDTELAGEAIKALGMAGTMVGQHLATIDGLREHRDPGLAKRATSLSARLRAMGCSIKPEDPGIAVAAAKERALIVAVNALSDTDSDAVAAAELLLAVDSDQSFPLLVDRFRQEQNDCPDRVLEWIGRLGRSRPQLEREAICYSLAMSGTQWSGPSFSSHSGAGGQKRDAHWQAYGALWVGAPANLEDLVDFLTDDNTLVRLAAARSLMTRAKEFAGAKDGTSEALWQTVIGEHPKKARFATGRHGKHTQSVDVHDEIRTAAAIALQATEQSPDRHGQLLRHAIRHENATVVTAAIVAWGAHADIADLEQAAKDKRAKVAEAAKNAIARRAADK